MKNRFVLIFLLTSLIAQAQDETVSEVALPARQAVELYQVSVTFDKTSHIIFPAEIKYVDLGTADIIAEKPENVRNILRLKANRKYFKATNLTVVTSDGKFYPFRVLYEDNPVTLNLSFLVESIVSFEDLNMTEDLMRAYAHQIISEKPTVKIREKRNAMKFSVPGIYIKDNVIFIHLMIENESHVNYDIDFIRFYVRDKKIARRTSQQELEQIPAFVYDPSATPGTVVGKASQHKVFVMEKFTIPDEKNLEIELFERRGGRHLKLTLRNKDLVGASLISGAGN